VIRRMWAQRPSPPTLALIAAFLVLVHIVAPGQPIGLIVVLTVAGWLGLAFVQARRAVEADGARTGDG